MSVSSIVSVQKKYNRELVKKKQIVHLGNEIVIKMKKKKQKMKPRR